MILTHLRADSRKSLAMISRETNIPISTIFDKVNKLGKSTISKYSPLLDFQKLGFGIRINFALKANDKRKQEFKDFLLKNKNVNSMLRLNNGFDFFIETVFRDMKGLEEFSESLEPFKIKKKKEFFIIEDLKKEDFFTKPEHIKLLG
ncbi:Lrp/AsnC family transcriptional regulator [Candidatus Woesearchaeota archaeon]|nr:Lrp/AsnC family transcriptional regulator [Candidatus Woesearchaeota archaeon]